MKKLLLLTLSLALCGAAHAQSATQKLAARQTFERFRALNQSRNLNTPAARNLAMGEAIDYIKTPQLGPMSAPDALVFPARARAVARVQGLDDAGKPVVDIYFTLQQQGEQQGATWKVSALRALALTGIPAIVRDKLKAKKKTQRAGARRTGKFEFAALSGRRFETLFSEQRRCFWATRWGRAQTCGFG